MSEPAWELLGGGGVGVIDYVGDWVAGTTYLPGQIVRYAGVDYMAVNASLGQVPPRASPYPQAMVCIADQVLAANAATIFALIPAGYSHLRVLASLRSDSASGSTIGAYMRLNSDAGTNYHYEMARANAGALTAPAGASINMAYIGETPTAASVSAARFSQHDITILDYLHATHVKNYTCQSVTPGGDSTTSNFGHWVGGTWIAAPAPISRIDVFPGSGNAAAGSRLTVYGMLAQGQSPPVTTLSPGGFGTSFPVSPANGELFTLVDSLTTPTYAWDFRYVASITDAYKWVFVGGAPVIKFDAGTITTTSAGYVVGTNGSGTVAATAFTAPRAGIYAAETKDEGNANTGTAMYLGIRFGSYDVQVGVPYGDAAKYLTRAGYANGTVAAAGTSIQPIHAVGAGTLTVSNRQISILPVRLS